MLLKGIFRKLQTITSFRRKIKKILLVGFYGADNLGDELMLETLLNYLSNISGIKISVLLCQNLEYRFRDYQKIDYLYYPSSARSLNKLVADFDIVIFGGGAIIDDSLYNDRNPDFNDLPTIFIELSIKAIECGKNIICLGLSSVEVLRKQSFIKKLDWIVNKSAYFSLRGKYSLNTLMNSNINTKKIHIIHDIVLANKNLIRKERIKKNVYNIGLNLICDEYTKAKFNSIIDGIVECMRQRSVENYQINLIPFYLYKENDLNYLKALKLQSKYEDKLEICDPSFSMTDIVEILKEQDIVISMRYHASLISLALGLPTLLLCYDNHSHYPNKMMSLIKKFNLARMLDYSGLNQEEFINAICDISLRHNNSRSTKIMLNARSTLRRILDRYI